LRRTSVPAATGTVALLTAHRLRNGPGREAACPR
jgi:hypothetical protein